MKSLLQISIITVNAILSLCTAVGPHIILTLSTLLKHFRDTFTEKDVGRYKVTQRMKLERFEITCISKAGVKDYEATNTARLCLFAHGCCARVTRYGSADSVADDDSHAFMAVSLK